MEVPLKAMILVLSAIGLLGCTIELSPEEQKIRVTSKADAVKGRDYKGTVKGEDNWGGPQAYSRNRAISKMMHNAFLIGADTVFQKNIYIAYNQFYALGEAFDCSKKKEREAHAAK